jgi:hypothetical protein
VLTIVVVAIIFVIWCRVFALAVTEEKPEDRIIWSLITFFGGPFGTLMYLFIRWPMLKREQRDRDIEMLRTMREEFEKSPSGTKA